MVKFCPVCKKIHPIGTTVCPNCHSKNLTRFCQNCKKIIPNGMRSCPTCGDADDTPEISGAHAAERPVGEGGIGKRWIAFLRGLLWVSFSLICLAGLYYSFGPLKRAILFATNDLGEYSGGLFLSGIAILLVCVLVAFITLAAGMVALDVAENIRRSANNTSQILEILDRQEKR